MAKSNIMTESIQITGDGFVGNGALYTTTVTNAAGTTPGSFVLAGGFNSIPVPATATGVIIVAPPGSANAKTLKGITGDTGIAFGPATPITLSFTAALIATIGVTSAGVETLTLFWF